MNAKLLRQKRGASITEEVTKLMAEKQAEKANQPTVWTLISGRNVTFTEITIPAEDVERLTKVNEHNRRVQNELKSKSLVNSIRRQQYQSCIAILIDGIYSFYDGSRRRAAAIEAHRPLRVMYCTETLTNQEVKGLIKELQSAEEHSLRDHGAYYESLLNHPTSPMTEEEIIFEEEISKSKFDRCMKAWSVPSLLIALFEDKKELGDGSYTILKKVAKKYATQSELESFVEGLDMQPGTSYKETMAFIVEAAGLSKKTNNEKPRKIIDISKDKWAKTRKSGDKQFFEISRATKEELAKIEQFIFEVLAPKT